MNYEIHDKELLAIVDAFKQWRVYLEGPKHEVQVYSDHKNLLYFTTTKVLNRRQVRWSEELSQYNFKIHYRKGSENAKADALSRRADYLREKPIVSQAVLQQDKHGNMSYNRQFNLTMRVEDDVFENEVRKVLEDDKLAQQVLQNIKDHESFEKQEGLLLFQGLVYVPVSLRQKLIDECHSNKTHSHQGIDKTIERLTRTYYFPHLRKKVEEVVRKCDICRRSKSDRHKPYGLLKSPTTPGQPWSSIALDFVVKLPKSKEPLTKVVYDSILVITDRLTKYGYFLPYKEALSAEELVYTFLRVIAANHGLPEEIISDRDKFFTSRFWKSLVDQLGIHHKLSTSYHPQTDGQTERLNQTMEQYLRCYVNYQQTNWVELLPIAPLAYNTAATETTGVSPFYANYGFNPATNEARGLVTIAQRAKVQVDRLKDLHATLQRDIQFASERSAVYHNKKRDRGPTLKRGIKYSSCVAISRQSDQAINWTT